MFHLLASTRRSALHRPQGALHHVFAITALLLIPLALGSCGASTGLHAATTSHSSSAATRTTAPPPYRPMVSMTQAWGPNAATATFSTQLDATHYMPLFRLAPDGRSLDGYLLQQVPPSLIASTPVEAGVLDIASHQFLPIGVASLPKCFGSSCQDTGSANYYLHCCQSDGRFLIAQSTGYPGPDCGGCLYAYDQQSGARYEALPAIPYQGVSTYETDHGTLVAGTGVGIVIVDLARRTLHQLPGTTGGTPLDAFAWPYVVYGSPSNGQQSSITPTPFTVYDLTSGVATPLPQVTGAILALTGASLYYVTSPHATSTSVVTLNELGNLAQPNAQPRVLATLPSGPTTSAPNSLGISGGSLFYTIRSGFSQGGVCLAGGGVVCPTAAPAPPPVTTLYEVTITSSGAPTVRAIAAFAADLGDVTAANARLVVLMGAVWDRAEGHFVDLGTGGRQSGQSSPALQEATGNFLLVAHALTQDSQSPFDVSLYDATRLPILLPASHQ
jgi:hypothetical protein